MVNSSIPAFAHHHQLVYHPIVFSDTNVYDMPQRINTSNFDSSSNMVIRDEEGFPSFLFLTSGGTSSFAGESSNFSEGGGGGGEKEFQGRGLENSNEPNPCVQC